MKGGLVLFCAEKSLRIPRITESIQSCGLRRPGRFRLGWKVGLLAPEHPPQLPMEHLEIVRLPPDWVAGITGIRRR